MARSVAVSIHPATTLFSVAGDVAIQPVTPVEDMIESDAHSAQPDAPHEDNVVVVEEKEEGKEEVKEVTEPITPIEVAVKLDAENAQPDTLCEVDDIGTAVEKDTEPRVSIDTLVEPERIAPVAVLDVAVEIDAHLDGSAETTMASTSP